MAHLTRNDKKKYGEWPPPPQTDPRILAIASRHAFRKRNNPPLRYINRLRRSLMLRISIANRDKIAGLSLPGVIERKPYTGINRQQRRAMERGAK